MHFGNKIKNKNVLFQKNTIYFKKHFDVGFLLSFMYTDLIFTCPFLKFRLLFSNKNEFLFWPRGSLTSVIFCIVWKSVLEVGQMLSTRYRFIYSLKKMFWWKTNLVWKSISAINAGHEISFMEIDSRYNWLIYAVEFFFFFCDFYVRDTLSAPGYTHFVYLHAYS